MKIGLIAMSGVRAVDPELVRLGLTLPGFVERGKTIASLPSLGLLTLAGMTPPQHECEYLEVKDIRDLKVLPVHFDLVAISSLTLRSAKPTSWRTDIERSASRSSWAASTSQHYPTRPPSMPMPPSRARENPSGSTSSAMRKPTT